MRLAIALTALTALLPAIPACVDGGAPGTDGGGRLDLAVAALSLDDVGDAVWDVQVDDGDPAHVVWTARLTASGYGAGGSLSYVGPCDASVAENTVRLRLIGIYADAVADAGAFDAAAPDGTLAFRDPGPLSRAFACDPNGDTAVRFDVTVLRPAEQGFFDIGVDFDDVFCSAKYDCDAGDLLDDGAGRAATQVLGFTCFAGDAASGASAALYLDDVVIDCGSGVTATVDPGAGPGNLRDLGADAGSQWSGVTFAGGFDKLFQVGVSRAATGGGGLFWNVALGVGDADLTGCTLTARGTADDAASPGGAQDGVVPDEAVYPYVLWQVDLGTCAGNHALDAATDVTTEFFDVGEGWSFAHGYPPVEGGGGGGGGLAITSLTADRTSEANAIAVDPEGNVYIAGFFDTTIDFGGGVTTNAFGGLDGFVAKWSPVSGWAWVARLGGSGQDVAQGLAWDADAGDLVVVGYTMSTTAHFDGADSAPHDIGNAGGADAFIAHLGADGYWRSAAGGGGTGFDGFRSVVTSGGNAYVTGHFSSADAVFGGFTPSWSAGQDVIVASYDAQLGGRWIAAAGSTASDDGYAIAAHVDGRAVSLAVTGTIGASPTGFLSGLGTGATGFLAVLDDTGAATWKYRGGAATTTPRAVAFDDVGGAFMGGSFTASAGFGGTFLNSAGGADMFVAHATSLGWTGAWRAGSDDTATGDQIYGMTADGQGGVLVAGFVGATASFGAAGSLTAAGSLDAFVGRLDPDLTNGWVWARAGGGELADGAYAIAGDGAGGAWFSGFYHSNPATFGGATLTLDRQFNAGLAVHIGGDGSW
ncbi:MAG: hypothetical protein H6745_32810 [Deltaproteobacteria bacterium]|nr:hypothetical protein [Deltaproteobacteria bacterium]